jgi:aminopeptidase N
MLKRCTLIAVLAYACAAGPAQAASPGSAGIGDRLFPGLGNGGYDVRHYHLDARYATSAPEQPLDGTVTILARATQSLSRFDLDFAGDAVGSVSVDGRTAQWRRTGEELVITPRHPLHRGRLFVVRVAHFTATPTEPGGELGSTAFFTTPNGSATAPQPNLAHDFFPSNDHPRDKASYSFRIDVPAGEVAVANGVPVSRRTHGGRTVWTYVQRQPMASELLQLAVGRYDLLPQGRHRGIPVRDVVAPSLEPLVAPALPLEPRQLDYMLDRVGRYPFDIFGTFVVDAELGFALETQTISLLDRVWFTDYGQDVWDPTMLHELSHMWFGDSVSPYSWSDLWLNEGHASWYEFLYAQEHGELEGDTENYPDPTGYADVDDLMRAVYAHGDQWRHDDGPVARPLNADVLFNLQRYHGGALVLYALRQKIGMRAFAKLEREWVGRYRDRSASTEDFIALASRVAHRDLRPFLRAWLYGTKTPPMPGHPDWTVDPVVEQPAATASSLARAPRVRSTP